MTVEIRVPTLGESVTEATVGQWFKSVGDAVEKDEPLLELETDKVTLEVNAAEAGRLDEIIVAEGEDVEVGALLGHLAEGAGGIASKSTKEESKEEPKEKPESAAQASPEPEAEPEKPSSGSATVDVLPAAQKLIDEKGLDADQITGTGKDGRITKGDVLEALENGGKSAAASTPKEAPKPAAAEARPACRGRPRRAREDVAASQEYCRKIERCPEHGSDADHL